VEFETLLKRGAERILRANSVRIVTHNDSDGLSAGAIMCGVLSELGIPFHLTALPKLTLTALKDLTQDMDNDTLLLLCDMGSSLRSNELNEIGVLPDKVVVLDHHRPVDEGDEAEKKFIMVNPHLVGIDGAFELCASAVSYLVSRYMIGERAISYVWIAVAGILGDRQHLKGMNLAILEEGVNQGILSLHEGVILPERPLKELFENGVEPYLPMAGDIADKMGVGGITISMLGEREQEFANLLALIILKTPNPRAIGYLLGKAVRLGTKDDGKKRICPYMLATLLDACGKLEHPSVGIGVALSDEDCLMEAYELLGAYERDVKVGIKKALEAMVEKKYMRYSVVPNLKFTGTVASVLTRYSLTPDKPLLLLSIRDEESRVSARGNASLVSRGLDLSSVCAIANELGGMGGGHSVASGATLPRGKEKDFLKRANLMITKQLRSNINDKDKRLKAANIEKRNG
ncbi:MAG: DHH family phosphoesterase, partial [Methermicoccaceae archaeon]